MATVARAFKATAPAAQRLRRTRDPLTSSSVAQHFTLPSGSHFVVRPPPSVLPPTLPVPPTEAALPHADKFAQTPFASAVHQPAVASSLPPSLHAQQPQQANQHLLAPSRPPPATPEKKLSPQEVQELQALRRSDSNYWTTGTLARKFGVSRNTVTMLGFGEGIEAERIAAERKRVVDAAKARREERYGWRKAIAREERQRRRTLW
ncbi:hypothetical protein NBRC10512_006415 [Rhodotorula toruloides]|uniref:RHTO0S01e01398g1_1 n=2 Tax=Rhodotorula toruloides TaxID=5286 RepID=A0A061AEG8_RHOTO|nr:uncharacterized protein RHTO_04100 [Rhodotorula toruloides NP11]EMS19808.1 hypothetical protein RHTO_04100 [Rhodotorula toruloides NP11]CDR35530.1 RHTO0S01e01398g1_1 [Rhodotorula toruloides]